MSKSTWPAITTLNKQFAVLYSTLLHSCNLSPRPHTTSGEHAHAQAQSHPRSDRHDMLVLIFILRREATTATVATSSHVLKRN